MPDYNLLFKCLRCGWWATGRHRAEEQLSFEELDASIFDVRCTGEDCSWSARLPGCDGYKKPTDHLTQTSGPSKLFTS